MRNDILEQAKAIRAATLRALGHITEDNERLLVSVLYPRWTAGSHAAGDIYTAEGQVWECHQAYDNAAYPGIVPGGAAWGTFNRPLHGTSPETARPFVAPTGAHDIYKAGEYMTLDDALYHCLEDTAFSPVQYAAAWEAAS